MSGYRTGARIIVGLIAMVFLFPALIVFLFGLAFWGDELDKTAETTGTVSSLPRAEGPGDLGYDQDRGSASCYVDIEFVVQGRTFTVESDSSSSHCDRRVGEQMEVHYDPSDPYEYTAGSKTTNQVVGIVMMVAAGIWTLIVTAFTWGLFRVIKGRSTPMPPGTLSWSVSKASWLPGAEVATGEVRLGPYETYDGGTTPRRTVPDLAGGVSSYDQAPPPATPPPATPPPATPLPPAATATPPPAASSAPPPPGRIWNPAKTDERPDKAGWYPTGDGTLDRWYNGLSWSDATRPRGGDPT